MKILTASYVLPIDKEPISHGAVAIENKQIVEVGSFKKVQDRYPQAEIEDFGRAVIMPGLVNAQTQLDLLNFDGKGVSGESLEFLNWTLQSWNHQKKLTPAERRQCLESGIRQLLQSGTTCVGDRGQYVGVIPQAANSPLRMVLFPELVTGGNHATTDGYEAVLGQVEEILESRSTRFSAGVSPYAPYTLSRSLLKIIAQQADQAKIPLSIHAAESFAEMQFFYESSGEIYEKIFPALGWTDQRPPEHRKTPIQYLHSIGFLENAPILIGCNHLSETDLQLLAKSGAKVIHSPRSNHRLKLGYPPIKNLRRLKVPVALATHRTGSLLSLSLWDEMRQILAHYPKNDRPKPEDILTMATLDGARALGLADKIGTLTPEKFADLTVIQLSNKSNLEELPEFLIQNTTEREIAAVYVEGKRLHG